MFITTHAPQDPQILSLMPMMVQASTLLFQQYQQYCAGHDFEIDHKSDHSPVTQADLKVNQYLLEQLAEHHPKLPVLSEESDHRERLDWPQCWMLDPLDGTKEFIHQRDEFTINLSLIHEHQTIFSMIAVPCEHLIYLGYLTEAPYRYDYLQQSWSRHCKYKQLPHDAVQIGLSHHSKDERYQRYMDIITQEQPVIRREAGSAYKFCMMLEGEIDIYPRFHPTSEWDTSAGQGLLESIGGGLLDLSGRPFSYNQRESILNSGFIAFRNQECQTLAFQALAQMQVSGLGSF